MTTNPIARTRQMSIGIQRLTSRPMTFGQHFLNSSVVWLALMAFWVLTDALIVLFPSGGRPVKPETG